jgi:uncharacterized protein
MKFEPHWPLRHAHIQSALASFKPRNWPRRGHALARVARAHVLDCGEGVRLQGWHSPQDGREPLGLAVLIHGWEGSHESVYLYSLACTLFEAGYNVFRLNLRDHGGTHALNEDLFHSARIQEVIGAVRAAGALDPARPLFVIGFSLGGNFALRIALRRAAQGVRPNLVVGICPAIQPAATLQALDHGPRMFHRYFLKKWRRTLLAKAAAWPGRYDFSEVFPLTRFTDITAAFVERYTEYGVLEKYLEAYTLAPEAINAAGVPVAIITAQDDPVVPYAGFTGLAPRDGLQLLAPRYGGHCGFVENLRLRSWAEQRVLELLAAHRK